MSKSDFSSAEAKLSRAYQHIANTETKIDHWLSANLNKVRFESNDGTQRIKVIFDSLHHPTMEINTIIGDAIGNLRSSLDYIAVALTYPITGKSDKISFPFADDANSLSGQVKATNGFGVCDVSIQNLFIDKIQAYKGGAGHTLWALNKLRNIEKHRFLVSITQLAGVTTSFIDINGNIFTNIGMNISAGESGTFIDAPKGHIKFTDDMRPTFQVIIEESPIITEDALVFLHECYCDIKALLDALKVSF